MQFLQDWKYDSRKNTPRKIVPLWHFFVNFFSNFRFHENFRSVNFFIINNNSFILYFWIIFSYAYIFNFQAWHILFITHICVTSNTGDRYLASEVISEKFPSYYASAIKCPYRSNFLFFVWKNCREIVNYRLLLRRKSP